MGLAAAALAAVVAAASAINLDSVYVVQSASNSNLHLRHCNYQLYAFDGFSTPSADFNWTITAGVHCEPA